MKKILSLTFIFLAIGGRTFGQGVRFSSTVTQQGTIGTATNAVVLPAAPQIAFCQHPANAVPCTNKATTYTDQTLATPCLTSTQIVRDGTNTCVATPDAQNNWGVWVAPNTLGYDYTITLSGGVNLGPFNVLSETTTLNAPVTITSSGSLTVNGTLNSNGGLTATAGANAIVAGNTNKTHVVDGVTFTTIQSAIDAWVTAGTGGKVFIPCGTYSTSTLLIPPYPYLIHLQGDAPQCVILTNSTVNTPILATSQGTVNTQNAASGSCASNCVSFVSGYNFQKLSAGNTLLINSVNYTIASVQSNTLLSLTSAPGTQSGVAYQWVNIVNAQTQLVENFEMDNITVQPNASNTTDSAGPAIDLSGFRNPTIDYLEYSCLAGATNTAGNWTEAFHHSAYPGLEYGSKIHHFKMSNCPFAPRRVDYCDNGGTTNSVNNSNENYFTDFWIYNNKKGPDTLFEHRRCAKYVVRNGLAEQNNAYTSTVNTQNAATGGCAGNCVTVTAGDNFNTSLLAGDPIQINSVTFILSSIQSGTVATLTTAPGTQTGVTANFGGVVEDFGQANLYDSTWTEVDGFMPFWFQSATDGSANGSTLANNYQTTPQQVQINANVQDVNLNSNTPDNVSVTDITSGNNNVKSFGSTWICYEPDCFFQYQNGTGTGNKWAQDSANGAGALGVNGGWALRDLTNSKWAWNIQPNTLIWTLNTPLAFGGSGAAGVGSIWASPTIPTIAAAGCGGAAASIIVANGTLAFKIGVGTTPGSACTITMPAATTGWNVHCDDITTQSTSVFVQKQTGAESTTSVTITNFSDVAVATAFVASDVLKCTAAAD